MNSIKLLTFTTAGNGSTSNPFFTTRYFEIDGELHDIPKPNNGVHFICQIYDEAGAIVRKKNQPLFSIISITELLEITTVTNGQAIHLHATALMRDGELLAYSSGKLIPTTSNQQITGH